MSKRTVIKGGTIVAADRSYAADIAIEGEKEDILIFLKERHGPNFEYKLRYMLGNEEGDDKEGVILNRTVTVIEGGFLWECDARHVELLRSRPVSS